LHPMRKLMEMQTGLSGQFITVPDYDSLGSQLAQNKVQLAVFHGFEFAWARQKYPDLRPLVVALKQQRPIFAYLVALRSAKASGMDGLKGKSVALLAEGREHCRLFLERCSLGCGQTAENYLGKVSYPTNGTQALDGLIDGSFDAAVVDDGCLLNYQKQK